MGRTARPAELPPPMVDADEGPGVEVLVSSQAMMTGLATFVGAAALHLHTAVTTGSADQREIAVEFGCWLVANSIGTLGALLPVTVLAMWCVFNIRIVSKQVAELLAVYVFWNLHLICYALWMLMFTVASLTQGLP